MSGARTYRALGALLIAAQLAPAGLARAQCLAAHAALEGGLDFTGTEYEGGGALCAGGGPPLRVAAWNLELSLPAPVACAEPLLAAGTDLGLPGAAPGRWLAVQLSHPDLCATSWFTLETSFADLLREGTPEHRGLVALAGVGESCSVLDLDQVASGYGPHGSLVPVRAIPPPRPLGPWQPDPFSGMLLVDVGLDDVAFHSDGRAPDAFAGYRLLWSAGEPTSSDPLGYDGEVLDPQAPSQPLGVIPRGTRQVTVAIPGPTGARYLAARPVYSGPFLPAEAAAVSAHRRVSPIFGPFTPYPELRLVKTFAPAVAGPGDPVHLSITVANDGPGEARNVELFDALGLEMAPGCIDLAAAGSPACGACTGLAWDAATGRLSAAWPVLAAGGSDTVTLDLVAGPGPATGAGRCANTAWTIADHHRHVPSSAPLDHTAVPATLHRDDSIAALVPRPDLSAVFPLGPYLDPAPALPFTDSPGLLSDAARPLVFWSDTRSTPLRLVKDPAPGVDSVVLSR